MTPTQFRAQSSLMHNTGLHPLGTSLKEWRYFQEAIPFCTAHDYAALRGIDLHKHFPNGAVLRDMMERA
jgi:hypothetical protein